MIAICSTSREPMPLINQPPSDQIKLRYFEDILRVEFTAINARRRQMNEQRPTSLDRRDIKPLEKKEPTSRTQTLPSALSRRPSPDPDTLFERPRLVSCADPDKPDHDKIRPQPVPFDATGLAFSGGAIRSAAICLGALQALHCHRRIESMDYISTVSGGGYIGCCLSAAMSYRGGRMFPFGDDASDSGGVAHLCNYSNYLMPRGRSGISNVCDLLAVIFRGLLANSMLVLGTLVLCALVTWAIIAIQIFYQIHTGVPTGASLLVLAALLIFWAALRSNPKFDEYTDDTEGLILNPVRISIVVSVIVACVELHWLAVSNELHR